MTFVMRMLARELRSSWQRLLFFFVCVAVGVGAIVLIATHNDRLATSCDRVLTLQYGRVAEHQRPRRS